MPIDPKHIDQIADGLTDDPDVFKESFGAVAKAGLEAGKKCAANPQCRKAAATAGKWVANKGKEIWDKRKAKNASPTEEAEEEEAVAESFTHKCRNRVYRRGIVMACGKACNEVYCENCEPLRSATSKKMLGEAPKSGSSTKKKAKKEPSNKPDDLDVEDSFEIHDGYDEDKKEPTDKQKRKSSLQDGPEGEKGSKKTPYLK